MWALSGNLSPSAVVSKQEWHGLCKGTWNFSQVSVRDPEGLCLCPGPSLSASVPRACKQKSPESLCKGSSYIGCLGRAGDAAEQSSWKSNYELPSPAKELTGWAPAPLQLQTKRREKRLCESQIPFHGWGGNVPRVLFFLLGCQHPILLKSLCWSGWSPPPLSTVQGAFLWEELGAGRSWKHHWFLKRQLTLGTAGCLLRSQTLGYPALEALLLFPFQDAPWGLCPSLPLYLKPEALQTRSALTDDVLLAGNLGCWQGHRMELAVSKEGAICSCWNFAEFLVNSAACRCLDPVLGKAFLNRREGLHLFARHWSLSRST